MSLSVLNLSVKTEPKAYNDFTLWDLHKFKIAAE
jgi:hypothetical protein